MKLQLNGYFQCVKLNGKAGANCIVTGRSAQTLALISSLSSIPGELDKVKEVGVSFSASTKFIFDILTLMFSSSAPSVKSSELAFCQFCM